MAIKDIRLGWRNIKKNPYIYLINIFGLSIGIASFLFILAYVNHEHSYDQFHKGIDQLYRINHVMKQEGKDPYIGAATFAGVGPALAEDFEQIEMATRLMESWHGVVAQVDRKDPISHEQVFFAESSFFDLFSIPVIHGDPSTILDHVHTVVLSKEVAKNHFGETDCIGKKITLRSMVNGEREYVVSGVVDNSHPTHLDIDIFISFSSLLQAWGPATNTNWSWFDFITYVRLKKGTDIDYLEKQFVSFIDTHGGRRNSSQKVDFDLFPVAEIHLQSNINQEIAANGNKETVQFLMIVGAFILIIAWINYTNLYVAKATDRSKEVGIRKALGAAKSRLVIQFLIEAGLINGLSIAIGLIGFLTIRMLSQTYLGVGFDLSDEVIITFLALVLPFWMVSVFFSGIYPALFVAKIGTLKALKGLVDLSSGAAFRKSLVVFQFMISGFMIGGTIVVYNQLTYMNEQSLGVDVSHSLVVEVPNLSSNVAAYASALKRFTHALTGLTGIEEVSPSSDMVGSQVGWRGSSILLNRPNERRMIYKMTVGKSHLEYLKVDFLAGRSFYDDTDSLSVILNKEALEAYGFDSPEAALNQRIYFAGMDTMQVIGIIDNYFQESLREPFKPTAYFRIDHEIKHVLIRSHRSDHAALLKEVGDQFQGAFPNLPFEYNFMEDLLANRHHEETVFNYLFNAFSAISIFISFLGLLGLAYYVANKRKKEVGVRKVLGSTTWGIVWLVFKDFARLVMLGNLIALPILWQLGSNWLGNFSFHIEFPWMVPFVTLFLCILFSFAFTLSNILKLGRTNPVKVLKEE